MNLEFMGNGIEGDGNRDVMAERQIISEGRNGG